MRAGSNCDLLVEHMSGMDHGQQLRDFLQALRIEKYASSLAASNLDITALLMQDDIKLAEAGLPVGPRRKISVFLRPWLQEKYTRGGLLSSCLDPTRPHAHLSHPTSQKHPHSLEVDHASLQSAYQEVSRVAAQVEPSGLHCRPLDAHTSLSTCQAVTGITVMKETAGSCPRIAAPHALLPAHQVVLDVAAAKVISSVQHPTGAASLVSGRRAAAPPANLRAQYLRSLSSEQSTTACEAVSTQEHCNRREQEALSLSQLYYVKSTACLNVSTGPSLAGPIHRVPCTDRCTGHGQAPHSFKRKRRSSSSPSLVSFWCAAATRFCAEASRAKTPTASLSNSLQLVNGESKSTSTKPHSHHTFQQQPVTFAASVPHILHSVDGGTAQLQPHNSTGAAKAVSEKLQAFDHVNITNHRHPSSSAQLRSYPNMQASAGRDSSSAGGQAETIAPWKAAAQADYCRDKPQSWDSAQAAQLNDQQGGWPRVGLAPESNAQKAGKLQALRLELQAAEKLVTSLRGMVADMVASMQGCPLSNTGLAPVSDRVPGVSGNHGAGDYGASVPIQCTLLSQEVTGASVYSSRVVSAPACESGPALCKEASPFLFSVLDSDDNEDDMQ